MNPANTHAQPDRPNDPELDAIEALLEEEAACNPTPTDLESKVLALTDPRLLSLLDEALAPQAEPDQLAERIIAATSPKQRDTTDEPQRAVLGRIDPAGWRYAAAAAIVLATGIGLWWSGQHAAVDRAPNPIAELIPDWDEQDETQPLFVDATGSLDSALDAVAEHLDDYAGRDDSIWSDMDGYEDFLIALDPQT